MPTPNKKQTFVLGTFFSNKGAGGYGFTIKSVRQSHINRKTGQETKCNDKLAVEVLSKYKGDSATTLVFDKNVTVTALRVIGQMFLDSADKLVLGTVEPEPETKPVKKTTKKKAAIASV